MFALDRAFPFAEVQHGAVVVGQDLELNVSWGRDGSLQQDRGVAKSRFRLALGRLQGGR